MRIQVLGQRVFLGLLTAWVLPGFASAATGDPILIRQQFEIRSQSMGETRLYQVHRPANYDSSNDRYPVLGVLDGEEDFAHASTTVDALSAADRIPAMLVVGVPNTNRSRDLIPRCPHGQLGAGFVAPAENLPDPIAIHLPPLSGRNSRQHSPAQHL